jgi:polar amino acid transport system permease protein
MHYEWDFAAVFRHSDLLAEGALNTFRLAGVALLIAVPLGLAVAVLRLARVPVLSLVALLYTDLFRTAPSIVLIYWFFFALPLLLGIDFATFTAVALALGLQTGAYMAEVFRGGILAIKPGQWQAAKAIGMGPVMTLRYVVLPQAVRHMIPVFFTRVTELFKTTSLAAAISYAELVQMASRTASETFRPIETFTVVALFFFLVIFAASRLVRLAERRFAIPE